ncbi:MAG: hypothetical protein JW790_00485 [Dehalococcoidales bacterium]|nr:hypothetical protein [Dehalococcoidales bacterium]
MAEIENWLKYLEIISQRVRHHHDALWEEEKHYSWWIYPILAGTVWVLASKQLQSNPCLQAMIVIGACSIGIYLSWAAFMTIRREHKLFTNWLNLQSAIEKELKERKAIPNDTVKDIPGIGITTIFKANFVVTGIAFVVIIAISAYNFLWHIVCAS